MAVRTVQTISNMNQKQLSKATQDYLVDLLDPEKVGDLESMQHYYRVLFKDKTVAAACTNHAGHVWKKIEMQQRLRRRLEAKRR